MENIKKINKEKFPYWNCVIKKKVTTFVFDFLGRVRLNDKKRKI